MEKIYCVIYGKHRKFEKPKILYPWRKTLVLSTFWSKYKNEDEKILKRRKINWDIKNSWFNSIYI